MTLTKLMTGAAVALAMSAGAALAEGKLSIYHWFEYIRRNCWISFPNSMGSR